MRTRDWGTVDFYAELGVEPTASTEAIAVAFRGLAKRLHPDRPETSAEDAERFTAVVAAYEVLGNDRLRHAYDEVRLAAATAVLRVPSANAAAGIPTHAVEPTRPAIDPRIARRNARRWLSAGVAVFLTGVVVAVLVVRLQTHDAARRAGRVRVEAAVVPTGSHDDVRFHDHLRHGRPGARTEPGRPRHRNPRGAALPTLRPPRRDRRREHDGPRHHPLDRDREAARGRRGLRGSRNSGPAPHRPNHGGF